MCGYPKIQYHHFNSRSNVRKPYWQYWNEYNMRFSSLFPHYTAKSLHHWLKFLISFMACL